MDIFAFADDRFRYASRTREESVMNLAISFGERHPRNRMRRRQPLRARPLLEVLEARALLSQGPRFSGFVDEVLSAAGNGTLGEGEIKNPSSPIGTTSSTDPNVNTDSEVDLVPGPHSETTIAVNPTNPLNMIGSANDHQERLSSGGHILETVYSRAHVTFDGGQTWSEYPIQFNAYASTGDPAAAFDADGTAYLATVGFRPTVNPDILAAHSTDGGQTWSMPSRVASGTGTLNGHGTLNDKPYLAAWGHGNAVVTWTLFTLDNGKDKGNTISSPIYASITHDGGQTWTPGVQISGDLIQDQASVPVVAADGSSIYVAFESTGSNLIPYSNSRDQYYVVRLDPTTGERIAGPFKVADLFDGPTDYPINIQGFQTYQDSEFRTWSVGNIAADPTDSKHLAVIWSDMSNSTVPADPNPYVAKTNSDILVSQSFDGGQTWSSPTAITLPGDQFMPWGAYDASGKLQIGFFDRSYDPNNHLYGYTLASETGLGSLSFKNQQVTTALSNPTTGDRWFAGTTVNPAFPNPTRFLGDYGNIAVTPSGDVAALWTDMRNSVTFTGRTGSGEDAYFALVDPPPPVRSTSIQAQSAPASSFSAASSSSIDSLQFVDALVASGDLLNQGGTTKKSMRGVSSVG
jgi:BNR/Asp-box repeat